MSLGQEYYHPVWSPDDSVSQSSAHIETRGKEIPLSGVLEDFLRKGFFRDYLEHLGPSSQAIPTYANDILRIILSDDNVGEVLLTGSIPKFIVRYEAPEHFWGIGRYFASERDAIGIPQDSPVYGLLDGLADDAAADMDINMQLPTKEYVVTLYEQIASHYRVAADRKKEKEVVYNEQPYTVRTMQFTHPSDSNIRLEVYAGPVPTNPNLITMNIAFFDTARDERIFRIDMSALPATGAEIEREKRHGKTTKKQDEVVAELSLEGDQVWYFMTEHAVAVMDEEDAFRTESQIRADVLEIILRGLRMNALDVQQLRWKFDTFMPGFTSESVFDLQLLIQKIVREGINANGTLGTLPLKELALCLTIDPYVTVQALRDSSIALLIPGLAHISREQWEELLHSRHMVVEGVPVLRGQRTSEFMAKQRDLYLWGDGRGNKPYNGVEMFIRALQDLQLVPSEGNIWELYIQLWKKQESAILRLGQSDKPMGVPLDSIAFAEIDGVWLFGSSDIAFADEARQKGYIGVLARRLLHAARGEYDVESRIPEIIAILRQHEPMTNTTLFEQIDTLLKSHAGNSMSDEDLILLDSLQREINGVALVYQLLELFPSGLTAKQLKRLYHDTQLERLSVHPEFSRMFLNLKLYGLVYAHRIQRKEKSTGKPVEVIFYSLRRNRSLTRLTSLHDNTHFFKCFQTALDNTRPERFSSSSNDLGHLTQVVNMFLRNGLKFMEILLSFTPQDFALLRNKLTRYNEATYVQRTKLLCAAYTLYQAQASD